MLAVNSEILLINLYPGKKEAGAEIISIMSSWKDNYPKLYEIIQSVPVLKEMRPMALNLNLLAESGIETVNSINKNQKPGQTGIMIK